MITLMVASFQDLSLLWDIRFPLMSHYRLPLLLERNSKLRFHIRPYGLAYLVDNSFPYPVYSTYELFAIEERDSLESSMLVCFPYFDFKYESGTKHSSNDPSTTLCNM